MKKTTLKRVFTAFMATAMAFSLAACGKDATPTPEGGTSQTQDSETQTTEITSDDMDMADLSGMTYEEISAKVIEEVDKAHRNFISETPNEDAAAVATENEEALKFFRAVKEMEAPEDAKDAHAIAVNIAADMITYYEAYDNKLNAADEASAKKFEDTMQESMDLATASQLEYMNLQM